MNDIFLERLKNTEKKEKKEDKDEKTRENNKKFYIKEWLTLCEMNPDMPIRDNYRGVPNGKINYRRDKDIWNAKHTDYSEYLERRKRELLIINPELEKLYNCYSPR